MISNVFATNMLAIQRVFVKIFFSLKSGNFLIYFAKYLIFLKSCRILFEIGIAEFVAQELSSMLSANVEMGARLARRKMKGSKQTGEEYMLKAV